MCKIACLHSHQHIKQKRLQVSEASTQSLSLKKLRERKWRANGFNHTKLNVYKYIHTIPNELVEMKCSTEQSFKLVGCSCFWSVCVCVFCTYIEFIQPLTFILTVCIYIFSLRAFFPRFWHIFRITLRVFSLHVRFICEVTFDVCFNFIFLMWQMCFIRTHMRSRLRARTYSSIHRVCRNIFKHTRCIYTLVKWPLAYFNRIPASNRTCWNPVALKMDYIHNPNFSIAFTVRNQLLDTQRITFCSGYKIFCGFEWPKMQLFFQPHSILVPIVHKS